jgi:hypothetical protein
MNKKPKQKREGNAQEEYYLIKFSWPKKDENVKGKLYIVKIYLVDPPLNP